MIHNIPPIIQLEEVSSTNDFAQDLIRDHRVANGTCVAASYQSAGKGQRGNKWISQKNNLLFSVIFFPDNLTVNRHFILNVAFSLAIIDYLKQKTNQNIEIKWPNDILINHKKICGILIENSIRGNQLTSIIAGIGININQVAFEGTYNYPPVSLKAITGTQYNIPEELKEVVSCVYKRYNEINTRKDDELMEDYKRSLFKFNKPISYLINDVTESGILCNVNKEGVLDIASAEGTIKKFIYPEIKIPDQA